MKNILPAILVSCILSSSLSAQDKREPKASFAGLFVHDFDSTIYWYREKLGFIIIQEEQVAGRNIKFALLKWNDFILEMIQNPAVTTRLTLKGLKPDHAGTEGYFKLGFEVGDIGYWETLFKSRDIKFRYPLMKNERLSMESFIIEDPEGNLLQFYSFTRSPGSG